MDLYELIVRAQSGDQDAVVMLIERFRPLIKKYSFGVADDKAALVLKLTEAIQQYSPNHIPSLQIQQKPSDQGKLLSGGC